MFIPNTKCDLYVRAAASDNFGRQTYAPKKVVACAIIYLDITVRPSSVRADTSGSRGQAEQFEGDAMILFPKHMKLAEGDVVFKDEKWLEAVEVEPRRNVMGRLDHYQVVFRKIEPINAV